MSADDYLKSLVVKKANSSIYTQNEEQAFSRISKWVNEWFNSLCPSYTSAFGYFSSNKLTCEIQKSGSRAKGTSLKGKSDIDIFISITDSDNKYTVKEYYESLYEFLKPKFEGTHNTIRLQNVSLGLEYAGCDIDITPAKKLNITSYIGADYTRYNDHFIYSRKRDCRMQTNIQKHIDMVRYSGLQNEIMLIKMWRSCHGLDLPSIYIEILANEVLPTYKRLWSISENIWTLLKALRDTIETRIIIDPSNTNNIISDSLTQREKLEIKKAAADSLQKQYWEQIIW